MFSGKGLLFTYRKFLFIYKFPITPKEFAIVFDATPTGTIILFRNVVRPSPRYVSLPNPADSLSRRTLFLPTFSK